MRTAKKEAKILPLSTVLILASSANVAVCEAMPTHGGQAARVPESRATADPPDPNLYQQRLF